MRLTKPKSNEKNNYISKPHQKSHKHIKNISMDQISSKNDNNQSVYLHKILLKNLGNQSPEKNFPNYKENIENFQSSIQNIFSNEEKRQRAMKYVINMRSKRGNLSPFDINNGLRTSKNNNININNINIFSKTINDGFYDTNTRPNYSSSNKNKNSYKNQNKKNVQRIQLKPYSGFNIYSNKLEQFIPENSLMLENKNKLYEEYQSNKVGNHTNNNIYNSNNKPRDNSANLNNLSTRGKIPNAQDLLNIAKSTKTNNNNNNNNNKRIFYRKKKFSKNENLFIDSKAKKKYRYVEDDNDNNNSEVNNINNYNINNFNNEQSESDENKYEQTFDNNANYNNNRLKEIIIDRKSVV